MKNKKDATLRRLKLTSLNGSTKTFIWNALGFGGSRDVTVKKAIHIKPKIMKPIVRIVHPYPIRGIRCDAMIGKMIPPNPLPAAMMP